MICSDLLKLECPFKNCLDYLLMECNALKYMRVATLPWKNHIKPHLRSLKGGTLIKKKKERRKEKWEIKNWRITELLNYWITELLNYWITELLKGQKSGWKERMKERKSWLYGYSDFTITWQYSILLFYSIIMEIK